MPTFASGSASYAAASALTARVDWRTLAQLLSDTDTPLASQAAVEASARLATLMAAASGELEAACMVSNRYVVTSTRNDLDDLTGNSAEYRDDLICTLTLERLFRRRPALLEKISEDVKRAREALKDLREGQRIFGIVEVAQAGLTDHHEMTNADEDDRMGINVTAERLFGRRGWRRKAN